MQKIHVLFAVPLHSEPLLIGESHKRDDSKRRIASIQGVAHMASLGATFFSGAPFTDGISVSVGDDVGAPLVDYFRERRRGGQFHSY